MGGGSLHANQPDWLTRNGAVWTFQVLVQLILIYQSFIMSEQSLLQKLQGADATRAAAAAIRGESESTRAFTAERDLVRAWAAEHAELGTAADWRALEMPADIVRCVEQAELPGAPYFMGLVFTFQDARAAMRALILVASPRSALRSQLYAANFLRKAGCGSISGG